MSKDPLLSIQPKATTKFILFIFVIVHFSLVLTSAFHLSMADITKGSSIGIFLDRIGFLTGSSNHFGFFAPGVVSQFRATYTAENSAGLEFLAGDINQGNFETTFRFHNMIENFWVSNEDVSLRRALAASWAAKIMRENPQSKTVKIIVDAYVIPSMRQYRNGKRPEWIRHYFSEFNMRSMNE